MKMNIVTRWALPLVLAAFGLVVTACEPMSLKTAIVDEVATTLAQNNPAPLPTFSPLSGTYAGDQLVTITSSLAGATIYYSIDPALPSTSSTKYTAPLSVAGNGTNEKIHAIVVKDGYKTSDVATATYIIDATVNIKPTFNPLPGTYSTDQTNIILSTPDSGAVIHFTTATTAGGATTPTSSSPVYSGPLSVSGDGSVLNIKAIGVKGGASSTVSNGDFLIQYPSVATPTLAATVGGVAANLSTTLKLDPNITATTTTAGAALYYSVANGTSGTTPTTAYPPSGGIIAVVGDPTGAAVRTLSVVAKKVGFKDSAVVTQIIHVTYDPILIGFTPSGTSLANDSAVTVTTTPSTSAATGQAGHVYVYFTLDTATPPTTASSDANNGNQIFLIGSGSHQVNILATASQRLNTTATITYTITYTTAAGPTIDTTGATSSGLVHISATTGDTVYYTTDGSTPTHSSPSFVWGGTAVPVQLTQEGSQTVKAIAAHSGLADSAVTTSSLTVTFKSQHVSTLAGQTTAGYADGTGAAAQFSAPTGVAVDGSGNVYVADTGNNRIRKITPAGVVSTLAGSGSTTDSDNATGTSAGINAPTGITIDRANGVLYFTDNGSSGKLRKLVLSSTAVTTLTFTHAGDTLPGVAYYKDGYSGTGDALFVTDSTTNKVYRYVLSGGTTTDFGSAVTFSGISGVNLDNADGTHVPYVMVADTGHHQVVNLDGRTDGAAPNYTAGSGSAGSTAGTGLGTDALSSPGAAAYDNTKLGFVLDTGNNEVRQVNNALLNYAGTTSANSTDGDATAARFNGPKGITFDTAGALYVADTGNNMIRKIKP
jgi:hypothetical protein